MNTACYIKFPHNLWNVYVAVSAIDVPHQHCQSHQAFQVCLGFSYNPFYEKDFLLIVTVNSGSLLTLFSWTRIGRVKFPPQKDSNFQKCCKKCTRSYLSISLFPVCSNFSSALSTSSRKKKWLMWQMGITLLTASVNNRSF